MNGSPTQEFKCSKGLTQGVPLVPFLFLGVAEGLSGLMKEVKVKDLYMATRWVIKSMSLACYNMSMTIFFVEPNVKNVSLSKPYWECLNWLWVWKLISSRVVLGL